MSLDKDRYTDSVAVFSSEGMAGIGGKGGVAQILTAVAAALLLRLFSGPGPALLPEDETVDDGGEEDSLPGKVSPVTILWKNITCSLSDKSTKSVSLFS